MRSRRVARALGEAVANGGSASEGRFGSGVVALAESEEFASTLAGAMNVADPAQPVPAERGGRWF